MRPSTRHIAYAAATLVLAAFIVALVLASRTEHSSRAVTTPPPPADNSSDVPVKPTAYYSLLAMRSDPATLAYEMTLKARRCRSQVCLYEASEPANEWAVRASAQAQQLGGQAQTTRACRDAVAQLSATVSYDQTHELIKPDLDVTAASAKRYAAKLTGRLHAYETLASGVLTAC